MLAGQAGAGATTLILSIVPGVFAGSGTGFRFESGFESPSPCGATVGMGTGLPGGTTLRRGMEQTSFAGLTTVTFIGSGTTVLPDIWISGVF